MKKNYLLIALVLFSFVTGQSQNLQGRLTARGTDTSELYISTFVWNTERDSIFEVIYHSADNGKTISIQNKRYCSYYPGSPSAIYPDSAIGGLFRKPWFALDSMQYSLDTGRTLTSWAFPNSYGIASGCLPGEILIERHVQPHTMILRSDDYGSTFDTIVTGPSGDSLSIADVGLVPGEVYFLGYPGDSLIRIYHSLDYGATTTFVKMHFPLDGGDYDVRRGTEPGTFYLTFYDDAMQDILYIVYAQNYGNNFTIQNIIPGCFAHYVSYTGGAKPGTFYVVTRQPDPYRNLYIDYSEDYGVTFTRYTHYLDFVYNNINEVKESPIKIHPNPADHLLQITFPQDMGISGFEIFNLVGNRVTVRETVSDENKLLLDISDLPSGMYILQLKLIDGRTINEKLMIR